MKRRRAGSDDDDQEADAVAKRCRHETYVRLDERKEKSYARLREQMTTWLDTLFSNDRARLHTSANVVFLAHLMLVMRRDDTQAISILFAQGLWTALRRTAAAPFLSAPDADGVAAAAGVHINLYDINPKRAWRWTVFNLWQLAKAERDLMAFLQARWFAPGSNVLALNQGPPNASALCAWSTMGAPGDTLVFLRAFFGDHPRLPSLPQEVVDHVWRFSQAALWRAGLDAAVARQLSLPAETLLAERKRETDDD